MRTGRIILGVLSLLWGFLQAPFDHIHPQELEHQANAGIVHVHVRGQWADETYIAPHTADDDEIDVLWSAVASAPVVLHADLESGDWAFLPPSSLASVALLLPEPRGHDPPELSPKIPRAPPA